MIHTVATMAPRKAMAKTQPMKDSHPGGWWKIRSTASPTMKPTVIILSEHRVS